MCRVHKGSRVPPLRVVFLCRTSTTTFDEAALTPNPSNMSEYNPAAPNGSYDLTKPDAKGNSSSLECAACRLPPASLPACPRPACLVQHFVRPVFAGLTRQGVVVQWLVWLSNALIATGLKIVTCARERSTRRQVANRSRCSRATSTWREGACRIRCDTDFWSASNVCLISDESTLKLCWIVELRRESLVRSQSTHIRASSSECGARICRQLCGARRGRGVRVVPLQH